jgi:hypothetical protein
VHSLEVRYCDRRLMHPACPIVWDVATDVSSIVRELLSAVKTHLISPARKREGTAEVVAPATKKELNDPF